MREYVTDALVLAKEPLRDLDGRYFFFTKKFGKVVGKATSSRKITSKLAGHLEPGSFVRARFVDRNHGNGTQITDALRYGKAAATVGDLDSLSRILADAEPDAALWSELGRERFSWPAVLALLGWDPRHAACETCGGPPYAFFLPRQEFFCRTCASKLARNALLLLRNAEV